MSTEAVTVSGDKSLRYVDPKTIRENKEMLRGCNKKADAYVELVQSVKSKGILTPISVRDLGDGTFGLVDGLQRWNASLDLGLNEIPAQVITISDGEILEAQIVANAQKIETRPVEYTKALLRLLSMNPALTMGELANRLGKSTSWLNDRFHLLKLSDQLQGLVNEGKIPLANAYALSKVPDEHQAQFIENSMTQPSTEFVPQVQKFVAEIRKAAKEGRTANTDAFIVTPHFQKMKDVEAEIQSGKVADAILSTEGITDAKSGFIAGLKWALSIDKNSIEAAKAKYEQKKKELEEAKEKRKLEREKKKQEDAAKAAAEAGLKL
jgi:ParB family chromosome partitioning protein